MFVKKMQSKVLICFLGALLYSPLAAQEGGADNFDDDLVQPPDDLTDEYLGVPDFEGMGDIPPLQPPSINEGRPGDMPPPLPPENGIQNDTFNNGPGMPAPPSENFDSPPAVGTPMTPPDTGVSDSPSLGGSSPAANRVRPSTPPPRNPSGGAPASDLPRPSEDQPAADLVPEGQELVNIDFPEPTEIKDIIRAVSLWTGKNVILGPGVQGRVQMISPKKVTKAEAYQAFLSALNTVNLTTVETGKVLKIVPIPQSMKENLKTYVGTEWTPGTDNVITQIVPLRYIDSNEIQKDLSKIVGGSSLIAYAPTNTLIISDSGYKVRRVLEIIKLLDVRGQQSKLSIIPIRHADAKNIVTITQDIFNAQSGGARSGSKASGGNLSQYRIMSDDRTNSVVIFGPPRTIADVKAIIQQFDVAVDDPSRQASIHVRPLDYADATKIASTLSSLASGGTSQSSNRRPPLRTTAGRSTSPTNTSAPVAVLDDDLKITADESSNSLLITGSRAVYDSINSIIRKLDVRRSQVFIEAEILDINMDGGFSFGTSIFAGDGTKTGNKFAYTWEAKSLAPLVVSQASNATDRTSLEKSAGAFADALNIGVLGGFKVNVPGLGEVSPGALIKMVKTDSSTRVLSSPHMLTLDNEEAVFSAGDKLFFTSQTTSPTGQVVTEAKSEDVELALKVKPNISHSNYVTMKIDLTANSGNITNTGLPTVLKRKTTQTVTVKNGQTVVVSGLVKTEEYDSFSKIPLLGDIPLIGWLFRNTKKSKAQKNLMIFLTPYIVHGANDLAFIYKKKLRERDEVLRLAYGSSFKDTGFYKRLPTEEQGEFKPDAFDAIDETNREKRKQELLEEMGYERPVRADVPAEPEPTAERSIPLDTSIFGDTPLPEGADQGAALDEGSLNDSPPDESEIKSDFAADPSGKVDDEQSAH